MLTLLGRALAKVGSFTREEDCTTDFTRDGCSPCAHISKWMPRFTGFSNDPSESKVATIVRSALEIDEDTLSIFCDVCFAPDGLDYTDVDFGWLDSLECECLLVIGRIAGFREDQCLPYATDCGYEYHTYCDLCHEPELKTYKFLSDSNCDGSRAYQNFIFDVCNDPVAADLYRNHLRVFLRSKTASHTADEIISSLKIIFPNDEIQVLDFQSGKFWVTLNRELTQFERRSRELLNTILPINEMVSFRILEPTCNN